jgi:hypothetical protein
VVFGGAAALPDYLSLFCRNPLKAKYKMYSYPRYGLRYGLASATGNFQRLRGRPPLVSPLKSLYGPFFHGVNTGSNPVGGRIRFRARLQAAGSFERVETTVKTEATAAEKGWHRNYAKANNGCRDAPSFDESVVFPLPALFTRSCCFHHALSTTSSATRATRSL